MKTQIPIYRAKKIRQNKKYIIGSHIHSEHENKHWIRYEMPIRKGFSAPRTMTIEIDPSTLAIHFPDMIDSEGTKIFASLSEDGKGGDIHELFDCMGKTYKDTLCWKNRTFLYVHSGEDWNEQGDENIKVIGIQE